MDANKSIDLCIFDILKRYSNKNKRITQQFILDKLYNDYTIKIGRKALSSHISQVISFFDENPKTGIGHIEKNYKDRYYENETTGKREYSNTITSDLYYKSDFSYEEVNLLMDSIIFSHHIPKKKRKELLDKLEYLTDNRCKNKSKYIEVINKITSQNDNLIDNIGTINEAINSEIKIKFMYNEYENDKKLHPQFETTVIPYKIVAHNNHYYLICSERKSVVSYRVDKITELKKLNDEYFTPNNTINIKEYLASHPYMYSGNSIYIKMIANKKIIGDVIDYFGDDIKIFKMKDDTLEILLKSNDKDIYYWSLQYGNYAEIIEPQELRDKVRKTVEIMAKSYLTTDDDKFQKAIERAKNKKGLLLTYINLNGKQFDKIPNDIKFAILIGNTVDNCDFLSEFKELISLQISFQRIENFGFLSSLTDLETLDLSYTGFDDLSMIKNCKKLNCLAISEINLNNIEILYEFSNLKSLSLSEQFKKKVDVKRLKKNNPKLKIEWSKYNF